MAAGSRRTAVPRGRRVGRSRWTTAAKGDCHSRTATAVRCEPSSWSLCAAAGLDSDCDCGCAIRTSAMQMIVRGSGSAIDPARDCDFDLYRAATDGDGERARFCPLLWSCRRWRMRRPRRHSPASCRQCTRMQPLVIETDSTEPVRSLGTQGTVAIERAMHSTSQPTAGTRGALGAACSSIRSNAPARVSSLLCVCVADRICDDTRVHSSRVCWMRVAPVLCCAVLCCCVESGV